MLPINADRLHGHKRIYQRCTVVLFVEDPVNTKMVYDGEVKLRKMMRAYGVAGASEDVLISMLDPFHDEKLHLKGLPDMKRA